MKILIATGLYPPEIGGPATHTVLLEKELPRRGFDVSVLPFSRVRKLPKVLRHAYYVWLLLRASKGADLMYVLDPVSVGLPAYMVHVFTRKPYILRIVGDYAWEQGMQRFGVKEFLDEFVKRQQKNRMVRILVHIEQFVAKNAEHIIVPSTYMKGIVGTWDVEESKMTVVYNAFTPPPLGSGETTAVFAGHDHVIMSAGRLVPWKGFRTLIETMGSILVKYPGTLLAIVGDGPQRPELEARVEELGLSRNVVFMGRLSQKDLVVALRQADVFVLNTAYEGFSHQLLEVMALGIPVVTTDVGGNPELINNEKEGLLVPYNDSDALYNAIERLIRGGEEVQHFVEMAESKARSFSIDRMVESLVKTFITHSKQKQ